MVLFFQMMLIVIDKMVKLQYIQCSTVVNWIFSKEMESEFMRYIQNDVMKAIHKNPRQTEND